MNKPTLVSRLCLAALLFFAWSLPMVGSTWYVRPDGGTRYSANVKNGQCDGTADAPYPGKGSNQHCAFKEAAYLWSDGSYAQNPAFPVFAWIGAGGDTYIIRGSLSDGVTYRVGWNNPTNTKDEATGHFWGLAGDPYRSGAPVPPSGTAEHHTRILGGNFAACTDVKARTQLHGGYGVDAILSLAGASYVDVQCLDLTDFSSCSKSSPDNSCNRHLPLSDYATSGLVLNNATTHVLVEDVAIHGLAGEGIHGPTGDDVTLRRIALRGNAMSGWNADDGSTGTGRLLVQDFDISWNGCQEEYPLVHALPYSECLDDNVGGYGDGFGTATRISKPGWQATFDTGTVSYNTQDGLDALHLQGAGSSMTVRHVLAFGNMGQQVKIGGASGAATDNRIVTNCRALHEDIPGTPAGFNRHLTDFCRAADTGILMTVGKDSRTIFDRNVVYSGSATGFEVECDGSAGACDSSAQIEYRDNIFLGFPTADGQISNPIYLGTDRNPFLNPGSVFDHNVTFHAKGNWSCPQTDWKETHAICADPRLKDESWHAYGYGDMSLTGSLPAPTAGTGHHTPSLRNAARSAKRGLHSSLALPTALVAVGAVAAGGTYLLRQQRGS